MECRDEHSGADEAEECGVEEQGDDVELAPRRPLRDAGDGLASGDDPQIELAELLVAYGGGGVDHEVDGLGRLGEGDDFAERGCAGEDHHDAVEAEGDAAVRGGAVLECVEEEAEAGVGFFIRHP